MNRENWSKRCEAELGKPYIWGADGPDTYDCSGFAQFALSLINLDPPGDQTASSLHRYFSMGRSTVVEAVEDANLGDLLFFGSDEGIVHVALAWGEGLMLEAGGGGRKTINSAIAHKQHAEVRIRPIGRRDDLLSILRPIDLPWAADLLTREVEVAVEVGTGPGHFTGLPPLTEWLDDGRSMQLKRPFGYVAMNNREWNVPIDTIVDGASIPRVFWSLIGGPFEGSYRNASIVHDHFCDTRTQPWPDVHRMFHDAMLCSGVPGLKARIMYYAVYRFGPRWVNGPSIELASFEGSKVVSTVPTDLPTEAFDADSFIADSERIAQEDLDLPAIERLADERTSVIETVGEASLSVLATEVNASWARQPLLHRLVALQDADLAPDAASSVGALLSRYAAQTRSKRAESADAAVEATVAFDTVQSDYERLFANCQIRPERQAEVAWHRARLLQYRARYETVSNRVGIPWWFIGIIHALEASFNFAAHLHNGDPLEARTEQVPKGRPAIWNPPNDWESSAADALTYEKFTGQADWSLAAVLYRWERYNGMGYRSKGINSPYLWSFSNHYSKGKFVKDKVFDPNKQSRQCGAAVMLLALKEAGHVQI